MNPTVEIIRDRVEDFVALLHRAGLAQTQVWSDAANWFAVLLARP